MAKRFTVYWKDDGLVGEMDRQAGLLGLSRNAFIRMAVRELIRKEQRRNETWKNRARS